jgi:DNA-binding XRE family transcriptional regulator
VSGAEVRQAVLAAQQAAAVAREQVKSATESALVDLCIALRERREALGMTQQHVADGIGLSRSQIANIEAGRGISAEALVAYAAVLGASLTLQEDA